MIHRNFFSPEQVALFQSLIGNTMVGLFNDENKQEINYEPSVTIATEETNICLSTFDVLEGLDHHRFEDLNVWCVELGDPPDRKLPKPDYVPDWFAGQEVLDVQVIRTKVTSFEGEAVNWTYMVDTGIFMTFDKGHLSLIEANFDWPGFLEAKQFDINERYDLPQTTYPFGPVADSYKTEGWPPSRYEISSKLVSLSEANRTPSNFLRGLARRYFEYTQGREAFRLQKLVGHSLSGFTYFGDKSHVNGVQLATDAETIEILSDRTRREFLGGPIKHGQRYSYFSVDAHIEPNANETPVADFEYLGQKITRIELVDELMIGKIFGQAKKTMPWSYCAELSNKYDSPEGHRWEYGSTVAIVIHFETGSLVISRACFHDWVVNVQVVPLGEAYTFGNPVSRFKGMKDITIETVTRGSHMLESGEWRGLGPLISPQQLEPGDVLSQVCPRNCTTKVFGLA